MPANLSPDIVYGNPSFFKKEFTEVKDVIQNVPLKEALINKIKQDLVQEELDKQNKKIIDWRNKAFLMRHETALNKIEEIKANHWTENAITPNSKQITHMFKD